MLHDLATNLLHVAIAVTWLGGGLLYWMGLKRWFRNARETWWIVAWLLHCRGDRAKAKRALTAAIRADEHVGGGA
ncbi:MAG: hypothetical protein ACIAQU_02320 [Phycisphaerales bacterium JB064]